VYKYFQLYLQRTGFVLVALAGSAWGGPGHDHGDGSAVSASSDAPKRQPDGSVFLPKIAQRQLQVRTVMVSAADLAQTVELSGRITADPNAGGKVQPTQAGRVEAGPRGLPSLGQAVKKGEVLAYVRASETATPELKVNLELARKKLARLEQLEGSVPQREIDTGRIEVQSLSQRLSPAGGAYVAREALAAPISGVIAAINVVAGQVVDAREVLIEVIDAARLQVEAQAFDATLPNNIASATMSAAPTTRVDLEFIERRRDSAVVSHQTKPEIDGVACRGTTRETVRQHPKHGQGSRGACRRCSEKPGESGHRLGTHFRRTICATNNSLGGTRWHQRRRARWFERWLTRGG
jgi:multidrug efflux pump subunit AcrA (membrane-fusion protein)